MTVTREKPIEREHWATIFAKKLIEEKEEPYNITAGATVSGPLHLGTLCEALYPQTIINCLKDYGKSANFYFILDDLDAFDSVPAGFENYKMEKDLGKPLRYVADPFLCHDSFALHLQEEVKEIFDIFEINAKIFGAFDLYSTGKFDKYVKIFHENFIEVRSILEITSDRQLEENWHFLMPICENCGKIATTSVINFDGETYEYICNKKLYVSGCGYKGKAEIKDHKYKIVWRLHWPSWMDLFNTSLEGAGVDHHTKGGSWYTAVEIFRRIFKKKEPIGVRYGWLFYKGKKFSKSLGVGVKISEILKIMPPEIIKYYLLRPDIQENKDFDPSGYKLLSIYEDYEYASQLEEKAKVEKLSRADQKKYLTYKLSGKRKWSARFVDFLLYYQIFKDWEKVGEKLNDKDGAAYLSKYIENWIKNNLHPEEYNFEISPRRPPRPEYVEKFAEKLREDMTDLDIHNLVYSTAQELGVNPQEIFRNIYISLFGKEKGPRVGRLIKAIGVKKFKEMVIS